MVDSRSVHFSKDNPLQDGSVRDSSSQGSLLKDSSLRDNSFPENPFQENPSDNILVDPAHFFMGADRRAVLDEVIHLCQFSHNLVAVLGESGVGKSWFAQRAVSELREAARCCFIRASVASDVVSILGEMSDQLGIYLDEGWDASRMLLAFQQHTPTTGSPRAIIVVDDAHYLDGDVLSAFVSLLEDTSSHFLHVLLVADESLLPSLDLLDKGEVLVYDIPLFPLPESELEHYLTFKLSTVGYEGSELFDFDTVQSIWRNTRGVPEAVNRAANDIMLSRTMPEDGESSLGLPIWHMASVVALLGTLILVLFYVGDDEPVDNVAAVEGRAAEAVLQQLALEPSVVQPPEPSFSRELAVGVSSSGEGVAVSNAQIEPASKSPEVAVLDSEVPFSGSVESSSAVPSGAIPSRTAQSSKPAPAVNDNAPEIIGAVSGSSVPSAPPALTKPESVQRPQLKQPPLVSKPRPVLSSDEQAVMRWDESGYTLQLLAARQLSGVRAYVVRQPNRSALRVVSFQRDGVAWFAVVVGVYPSLQAARSGVAGLPPTQKASKPWPRKVSDVQRKIAEFRRR